MKRNRLYKILLYTGLNLLIHSGCSDIFEKDIYFNNVELLGPEDNLHTTKSGMTFWWSKVDGARVYNFQLVTPSFNHVELILIDTIVSNDKLSYTLSPGTYQWRVCGLNGSSSTKYSLNTLFVDPPLSVKLMTTQRTVINEKPNIKH